MKHRPKIFKFFKIANLVIIGFLVLWILRTRHTLYMPSETFLEYHNRGYEYLEMYEKSMNPNFIHKYNIYNGLVLIFFTLELIILGKDNPYIKFSNGRLVRAGFFIILIFFGIFRFITYRFIYKYRLSFIFIPTLVMAIVAYYLSKNMDDNIEKSEIDF